MVNSLFFAERLLKWYATEKRDLPWRKTKNPYFVWLSEIILQQTRVVQGLPYYLKFTQNYPTISHLANASEQEVLKLWQGLGYYSRAKNLHQTAKIVTTHFGGNFPNSYAEIIKLKGIGDYTASAIASICFEEATAVVDGNVYRVLGRFFGIDLPINTSQGVKYFKKLATELLPQTQIGAYNQALMDFGATCCTPLSPQCTSCIFNDKCRAFSEKKVNELPVKIKKTRIKNRYFHYCIPIDLQQNTLFLERKEKDVWQGLFEFPLLEVAESSLEEIPQKIQQKFPKCYQLEQKMQVVHKLSHQHIYAVFWLVYVNEILENSVSFKQIKKLPMAILTANFLKNLSV